MPRGGKLTIATHNIHIDREARQLMPGAIPGAYTVLSVSDNGVGMSQQVQSRIFEPFFTTKAMGKGTGLGLSMVYGIVKQSGGYISVDSELYRGTRFQILFPAVDEAVTEVESEPAMSVGGNGETILLAEDEDALRESISGYLVQHGYNVLKASNGDEALQVAEKYEGQIHLLLTDVVMPKLEGSALALELSKVRPGIPTLFMSGYTDRRLLDHLPQMRKPTVLQKPLNLRSLLGTIGDAVKETS
jgi:CheY-like chemotaxis protein